MEKSVHQAAHFMPVIASPSGPTSHGRLAQPTAQHRLGNFSSLPWRPIRGAPAYNGRSVAASTYAATRCLTVARSGSLLHSALVRFTEMVKRVLTSAHHTASLLF